MTRILSGAFFLISFCTCAFSQGESSFGSQQIIYTDCTVPYQLVTLSVRHKVAHLYLLAQEKNFNEVDLPTLFTCLSKKYPEFSLLKITIFDDAAELDRAIEEHFFPPIHTNPPGPDRCGNGKKCAGPSAAGYNRAIYFRFDGREFFDYSDDKTKVQLKRVYLKKSS